MGYSVAAVDGSDVYLESPFAGKAEPPLPPSSKGCCRVYAWRVHAEMFRARCRRTTLRDPSGPGDIPSAGQAPSSTQQSWRSAWTEGLIRCIRA